MAVDLIKKSFKYWEAVKFTEVDMSFPKFVFLLESSNFIFGNKYCQLLSLMWRSRHLFSKCTLGSRCAKIHKEHSWCDWFFFFNCVHTSPTELRLRSFTAIASEPPECAYQQSAKGKQCLNVITKIVLTLSILCPRGPAGYTLKTAVLSYNWPHNTITKWQPPI